MAMPVALALAKELDSYTPCVTQIGNHSQEENFERLVYLIKKILSIYTAHFSARQKEKGIEALRFAAEKHSKVYRNDKITPYLIHVLEVTNILIDQKVFDYKIIISAIIHDVVEDTDEKIKDIKQRFGYSISKIVDLLTKHRNFIRRWGYWWLMKKEKNLNISWRAIVIKFADRIHNLMTLNSMSKKSKEDKVKETLEEFPGLYKVLIKTLHRLRLKGIIRKEAYLLLPFHLNNRLFYELSPYQ
ncbi:MAG: HD domain-containing protein [Candidatus Paceibacterota bacterium]|jgi:GTP pyrophosphokinase